MTADQIWSVWTIAAERTAKLVYASLNGEVDQVSVAVSVVHVLMTAVNLIRTLEWRHLRGSYGNLLTLWTRIIQSTSSQYNKHCPCFAFFIFQADSHLYQDLVTDQWNIVYIVKYIFQNFHTHTEGTEIFIGRMMLYAIISTFLPVLHSDCSLIDLMITTESF